VCEFHLLAEQLLIEETDVHAIADALYPRSQNLTFNPTRDKWFRIAVFDETWFLTIVYVSARQLALETHNPKHTQDANVLMDMVLDKLSRSVASAGEGQLPSDATICAISCLTSLEVSSFHIYCISHLRSF
jgi:hypothetical protein